MQIWVQMGGSKLAAIGSGRERQRGKLPMQPLRCPSIWRATPGTAHTTCAGPQQLQPAAPGLPIALCCRDACRSIPSAIQALGAWGLSSSLFCRCRYTTFCDGVDFQPDLPPKLVQHRCNSGSGFSGGCAQWPLFRIKWTNDAVQSQILRDIYLCMQTPLGVHRVSRRAVGWEAPHLCCPQG